MIFAGVRLTFGLERALYAIAHRRMDTLVIRSNSSVARVDDVVLARAR